MSSVKIFIVAVVLAGTALAQTQFTLGPIGTAAQCNVSTATTATMCPTTDGGWLVSIAKSPLVSLKGDKGDPGAPGNAATITIGTVTSGSTPSVTNVGTQQDAVLNFVLQPGQTGPQGPPGPSGAIQLPITLTITCPPTQGSIPKGWSAKCTLSQ